VRRGWEGKKRNFRITRNERGISEIFLNKECPPPLIRKHFEYEPSPPLLGIACKFASPEAENWNLQITRSRDSQRTTCFRTVPFPDSPQGERSGWKTEKREPQ
jgi:hypothetical protein